MAETGEGRNLAAGVAHVLLENDARQVILRVIGIHVKLFRLGAIVAVVVVYREKTGAVGNVERRGNAHGVLDT